MHAQTIIQDFLNRECPSSHAKRRACLSDFTNAAQHSGLGLLKLSKSVDSTTSLRHRIKRCDRLLSNQHLHVERSQIYAALARRLLSQHRGIAIIVDWSDLLSDLSQHLLRASVILDGRSMTIYEEVHPTKSYGAASVHRQFKTALRAIIPKCCLPIIVTDAGFRSTWFRMLDELGFSWIGRVRNVEMMRARCDQDWMSCKRLYATARSAARDLGQVQYVRSNPLTCRMVLVKKLEKGRHDKTVSGQKRRSARSIKQAKTQRDPWLLVVSSKLHHMKASEVVRWYSLRMQIEQTFRDLKNPQWGMGLRTSQTRDPRRLAVLLLIGALLCFALWLIGLVALQLGYRIAYGSKSKTSKTVSILNLARHWLIEHRTRPSRRQLDQALLELRNRVKTYEI